MSAQVNIFKASTGFNNKVVKERLTFDPQAGVAALEDCNNVLIDRTGSIVTRRGYKRVAEGHFHSFYPANGLDNSFYAVMDSSLVRVSSKNDGEVEIINIRKGLTLDAKMDYCTLGNKVFYANGFEYGVLIAGEDYLWPKNKWPGPDSTASFEPTPPGEHLEKLSGRILLSRGNLLFYTEYGLPGLVDMARNVVRFPSNIQLLASPGGGGVFVSDESKIYFLAGQNPREWQMSVVTEYPALNGGRYPRLLPASLFGLESDSLCVLVATSRGPCIGFPDGSFFNLIDKQVDVHDSTCDNGTIIIVDDSLILQSGGY